MKVFVAGAAGAIGRQLLPRLAVQGHQVTASTRSPGKAAMLRELGAEPAVVDGLDAMAVGEALARAEPEVVIHQMTSLAAGVNLRPLRKKFPATHTPAPPGTRHPLPAATAAALDQGAPGVHNVVDDDPASVAEWLPYVAQAVGAKPPRRVPAWLGRLAAGEVGVSMMTQIRGSSNAKAKRELGWQPAWPSWREGFSRGLDDAEPARRGA